MDNWNPILAEQHVKRVPFWQMALAEAVAVLVVIAVAWAAAVLILSLERAS